MNLGGKGTVSTGGERTEEEFAIAGRSGITEMGEAEVVVEVITRI